MSNDEIIEEFRKMNKDFQASFGEISELSEQYGDDNCEILYECIYTGKICYSQQIGKKTVKEELIGTLSRLKISKIDVYLIHSPRYGG